MGNYISCTNFISPPKSARVILPGGQTRKFRHVVTAAELMVDFPNFFMVNSLSLTVARRFQPLAADEDLQFGYIYVMFPMSRVRSMVTEPDMAVLFARPRPRSRPDVSQPRTSLDGGSSSEEFPVPEFKYKVAMGRSRKPMLDTVTEEDILGENSM